MARFYRDEHGIPHVRATDVLDLAHGQGEVTAWDRAFQLEWLRRRATGTTAAVVGRSGLDWDLLARRSRLADVARLAFAVLDEESQAFLAAYADGVSAGLADPAHTEVPSSRSSASPPGGGRSGRRWRSSSPSTCSSPTWAASCGGSGSTTRSVPTAPTC